MKRIEKALEIEKSRMKKIYLDKEGIVKLKCPEEYFKCELNADKCGTESCKECWEKEYKNEEVIFRRIDKALEIEKSRTGTVNQMEAEVINMMCPGDYFKDSICATKCKGILCKECWSKEYKNEKIIEEE